MRIKTIRRNLITGVMTLMILFAGMAFSLEMDMKDALSRVTELPMEILYQLADAEELPEIREGREEPEVIVVQGEASSTTRRNELRLGIYTTTLK